MPVEFRGRAILLDIEGTIAPIAFVYEVLFPYARARLASFLTQHWSEPAVQEARRQIADDARGGQGETPASRDELVAHVLDLMDRDVKATGLKQLQGLIWKEGFERGELKAHVFDDVPPALRAWHAGGIDVRIYSSGSVLAQRLFLSYTEHGDLTPFLRGYYDTATGSKVEAESYARILRDMGRRADEVLFVSDHVAELDAARAAGISTALALRPGNKPVDGRSHASLRSCAEVRLRA